MLKTLFTSGGGGVVNGVKTPAAMELYGVTSGEGHIKSSLRIDVRGGVCKEGMDRLGLKEAQMITDAEEIGGELKTKFVSFAEIQKEMESVKHLLFF